MNAVIDILSSVIAAMFIAAVFILTALGLEWLSYVLAEWNVPRVVVYGSVLLAVYLVWSNKK